MNKIAEILELIASGIDPITGEVFDTELIRGDPSVTQAIKKLRKVYLNKRSNSIYRKYEGLYSGHVIIMKEGCFYSSHNNSAQVINRELGYKLAEDIFGRITTGGPDLDKITKGLTKEGYSFVVVEDGEITQKYDGQYPFDEVEDDAKYAINTVSPSNKDEPKDSIINKHYNAQPNMKINNKISMRSILSEPSSAVQASNFEFSIDKPIAISEITRRINEVTIGTIKKKLSYREIASWLIDEGYLELNQLKNDKLKRRPTSLGNQIGIEIENRKGTKGEYQVVVYTFNAQKFIVDHLQSIFEHLYLINK